MSNNASLQLKDPSLLRNQAYINGTWLTTKASFSVNNPADGSLITQVPNMGAAEAEQAIQAAHLSLIHI